MDRFPRGALKTAIYDRLNLAIPTVPIYAVAPELNTPLPYGIVGRFYMRHGPLEQFKGCEGWSGTFFLAVYCLSSVSSDLDSIIDSVIKGITARDIELGDDWNLVELVIESVDVTEVIREDIGPLQCGDLTFRFSVLDKK